MKEMTKRERVLRTLNLQETDRTPVYDVIDNNGMREYYGKAKLTPENAWQLEYAAIKGALDMARGVMISEPNPGMVRVDDDGIEWYHGKEFFLRLKRLNNVYQEAGVKCMYHSDGNLMEVMDDLIAADIDGINPMEVMAGMKIREIKEKYGNKIFITGGIDVSQLMAFGTPDEVREACRKAIDDAGGIGYFLGSTTELHPAVKVENVVAMVEVAHTYKVKS